MVSAMGGSNWALSSGISAYAKIWAVRISPKKSDFPKDALGSKGMPWSLSRRVAVRPLAASRPRRTMLKPRGLLIEQTPLDASTPRFARRTALAEARRARFHHLTAQVAHRTAGSDGRTALSGHWAAGSSALPS